jgi:hypothetical protein
MCEVNKFDLKYSIEQYNQTVMNNIFPTMKKTKIYSDAELIIIFSKINSVEELDEFTAKLFNGEYSNYYYNNQELSCLINEKFEELDYNVTDIYNVSFFDLLQIAEEKIRNEKQKKGYKYAN